LCSAGLVHYKRAEYNDKIVTAGSAKEVMFLPLYVRLSAE